MDSCGKLKCDQKKCFFLGEAVMVVKQGELTGGSVIL